MKYLLEYNSFIDTIDFADVTDGTKSRSKPLTEEQFIKIFNENCKNFSFNNTQLYRGVFLKHNTDFFYINPIAERGETEFMKKAIKRTEYNTKLREDPDYSHLPDRNKCVIGSTHPKGAMITIGDLTSDYIQEDRTFILIPFDNIEIAIAPILDIQALSNIRKHLFKPENFILKKYTKNFKIGRTPKGHRTSDANEIWTEGECLLVRYSSLPRLKELVEQRS